MRLCLATGDFYPSETFVQAHLNRLPFRLFPWRDHRLSGGWETRSRSPLGNWTRALSGEVPRWVADRRRSDYLAATRSRGVLAHFGPIGNKFVGPCRELGLPLVVNFHGRDVFCEAEIERARGYGPLLSYASAFVAVSRPMERALVALGAEPSRVHYCPNGVETSYFRPRGWCPHPHVVAVGRMVEKKAPHLVLFAFAQAARHLPGARLTWVGDGPLRRKCEGLARELGLGVRFLGAQSPERVRAELADAQLFVQHSVRASDGDAEGLPVAVLEAQAMGLPVVATRHMGIPEVVSDGLSGILVEEGDWRGMGQGIALLLRDPGRGERMGREGRRIVTTGFSMERHLARVAQVVREAVEEKRVGPSQGPTRSSRVSS